MEAQGEVSSRLPMSYLENKQIKEKGDTSNRLSISDGQLDIIKSIENNLSDQQSISDMEEKQTNKEGVTTSQPSTSSMFSQAKQQSNTSNQPSTSGTQLPDKDWLYSGYKPLTKSMLSEFPYNIIMKEISAESKAQTIEISDSDDEIRDSDQKNRQPGKDDASHKKRKLDETVETIIILDSREEHEDK